MRYLSLLLVLFISVSCVDSGVIKKDFLQIKNASVSIDKEHIVVNTGRVLRKWQFTSSGVKTIDFRSSSGKVDLLRSRQNEDFSLPQIENELPQLVEVTLDRDQSLGKNIPFITLFLDYEYTKANVGIRYVISAFADAPGVKTQMQVKRLTDADVTMFDKCIVEDLNLVKDDTLHAVGYFQKLSLSEASKASILREELFVKETSNRWANFVYAEEKEGGIIIVKEAPHSIDNAEYESGQFKLDNKNSLQIVSEEVKSDDLTVEYKPCWATWSILYEGDEFDRQYALKSFDKYRYPIDTQRDVIIASDLTGSYLKDNKGRQYQQRETNFALELKAARNLGVDLVNLGSGWQRQNDSIWYPIDTVKYDGFNKVGARIHEYVAYSENWKKIRKDSDKYGLKVGLWTPAHIPFKSWKWNQVKGNFRWFQLDEDRMASVDSLISLESKIKNFTDEQGTYLGINRVLSRNNPSVGFFYGRDYGNLRLESLAQDQAKAKGDINSSWMLMRNLWYLSKYTNLNQYQIPVYSEKFLRTPLDRKSTTMFYPMVLSFMGTPLFYQELQKFDPIVKKSLRDFIGSYRKIRKDFYKGVIFPIGDEPSNKNWTGFHNYFKESRRGYICVFRESKNRQTKQSFSIKGLGKGRVKLTNIFTGSSEMVQSSADGVIEIEIKNAGDFRFFRYERIDI